MDKDKIKKQAEGLWTEVKKVAEKTKDGFEKVTKISQLKIDQTKQRHDRNNLLRELGELVFQMTKAGKKELDASVNDIIEQIDIIDNKIAEEDKEINSLRGSSKEEGEKTEKKEKKSKSETVN